MPCVETATGDVVAKTGRRQEIAVDHAILATGYNVNSGGVAVFDAREHSGGMEAASNIR